MQLLIVGVGQTFNFETKTMDDVLQVRAPDGTMLSIPTTNDAAQSLVALAMDGESEPCQGDLPVPRAASGVRDFPEGAQLFGGGEAVTQSTEGYRDRGGELEQQIFKRTQQTKKAGVNLGRQRNPMDRSGIPSMGIAKVDNMGNPILPAAPDYTMDDEEDPGEQV